MYNMYNELVNKQIDFLKNGGIDKVNDWALPDNVDYDVLLEAVKNSIEEIVEGLDDYEYTEFLKDYNAVNEYELIEKMLYA